MELRQLKYFVKTAELLSFTEAAEMVSISQSTLSQQIQQLEQELNTTLFNRTTRKISLTESGQIFLTYARQTIYISEQGRHALNAINNIERGEINIGVTYALRELAIQAIESFTTQFPNIKLNVLFATTDELIELLKEMKIDIVASFLNNNIEKSQLAITPLLDSPLVLVQSSLNPIIKTKSTTIEDLSHFPLALADKRFSTRQFLDEKLKKLHLKPKINIEINDISMLFKLVESGKWISIMSAVTIDPIRNLSHIPIVDLNEKHKAYLITLKDTYLSNATLKFCDLLKHQTIC